MEILIKTVGGLIHFYWSKTGEVWEERTVGQAWAGLACEAWMGFPYFLNDVFENLLRYKNGLNFKVFAFFVFTRS